jgi:hypothetical protein
VRLTSYRSAHADKAQGARSEDRIAAIRKGATVRIKIWIAGSVAAAALVSGSVQGADASSTHSSLRSERAAAAKISTVEANAVQAAADGTGGQANSVLSNPFIEQKVTTPESTGYNATHIPAGGF